MVLWDVAGRKRVVDKSFPVTEGSVRSVAFSPDGTTLAAGYSYLHGFYRDGGVVLWDVAGRKRVMQAPLPRKGGQVGVVAFSPDGKSLAGVYVGGPSPGGGVVLWDVAGRKLLCQVSPPPPVGRIVNVAFSPDGTTLAAAYSYEDGFYTDGGMVLWDVAEHKRVMQAPLPRKVGQVGAVAFSPDGKSLAGVYVVGPRLGGGVVLWDVAGRKRVAQDSLPAIKGWYTSVVFSPEGTTLAAAYSPARPPPAMAAWCCGTWPGASSYAKSPCHLAG